MSKITFSTAEVQAWLNPPYPHEKSNLKVVQLTLPEPLRITLAKVAALATLQSRNGQSVSMNQCLLAALHDAVVHFRHELNTSDSMRAQRAVAMTSWPAHKFTVRISEQQLADVNDIISRLRSLYTVGRISFNTFTNHALLRFCMHNGIHFLDFSNKRIIDIFQVAALSVPPAIRVDTDITVALPPSDDGGTAD